MAYLAFLIFCASTFVQTVVCQYPGVVNLGANQYGGFGYATPYGCPAQVVEPLTYGGAGVGDVAVAGEMPVVGTTAVGGQVPVHGSVRFYGDIPASGVVAVSGSCNCQNSFIY